MKSKKLHPCIFEKHIMMSKNSFNNFLRKYVLRRNCKRNFPELQSMNGFCKGDKHDKHQVINVIGIVLKPFESLS